MKKYFAYFIYDNDEYVIRFKIDGSLAYKKERKCFEDRRLYVRDIDHVVYMAAGLYWDPCRTRFCCLIPHKAFVLMRANGVKRWGQDKTFVIHWD